MFDDYLTPEEIRLTLQLKGKSRTDQDQIIGEFANGEI